MTGDEATDIRVTGGFWTAASSLPGGPPCRAEFSRDDPGDFTLVSPAGCG